MNSTVDMDAQIKECVPMSHVNTWGHGQGERNDILSSCCSAANSHEKEVDQSKRISPEPPKAAKAKAPPALAQAGVPQIPSKAPPATLPNTTNRPGLENYWDQRFENQGQTF